MSKTKPNTVALRATIGAFTYSLLVPDWWGSSEPGLYAFNAYEGDRDENGDFGTSDANEVRE